MKSVQISQELFFKLVGYHLLDRFEDEEVIKKGLMDKIDMLAKHQIYTKSKTAATEEEREKSRKEYLDLVGMHPDFRWRFSYLINIYEHVQRARYQDL